MKNYGTFHAALGSPWASMGSIAKRNLSLSCLCVYNHGIDPSALIGSCIFSD